MTTTRSLADQTWTDLNSPTKEEIDSLVLTQNIDPIIAKDMQVPTPTQSAIDKDGIIYAVLHIPAFKNSHSVNGYQEVDFIISQNGVVTARYDSIDALHFFAKQTEVSEILNKGEGSHMFFGIMKEIYKGMSDELAYIDDWSQQIENKIFEGREKEMVFAISNAARNLLNFRRIIEPHGAVFEFIREAGGQKFGQAFREQAKELAEEWRRVMRITNSQVEFLAELRETNNSMLSTKQNEIMKIFTIMAFVTFPLALAVEILGMDTSANPIMGHPNDFWIILGVMFFMSAAMFAFFKHRKWI